MSALLSERVKTTRVSNAVAAGTTDSNSSSVDMAGFDAVRFIVLLGTLTSTQVTKLLIQQSDDDSTFETIATSNAAADADSNKMFISDVYRPEKRYVRAVVDRGTANAVIDGVIAEQYEARDMPVTNGTTVIQTQKSVTPAAA